MDAPRGGWIRLWRKVWDCKISPRRRRLPYTEFEAWLDLLCRAVQDPEGTMVKNPGKTPLRLEAGELLCSYRGLQKDWRWGSHHKVRRFVAALCTLEMVSISSQNPTRLKIINAEVYGLVRPTNRASGVPAASQRRPTSVPLQEVKKLEVEEVLKNEEAAADDSWMLEGPDQSEEARLIQDWPIIQAEAGLPGHTIPDMSRDDKHATGGAGFKQLKESVVWAAGKLGGYGPLRALLVERAREHAAGTRRLFSLKALLGDPQALGEDKDKPLSDEESQEITDFWTPSEDMT